MQPTVSGISVHMGVDMPLTDEFAAGHIAYCGNRRAFDREVPLPAGRGNREVKVPSVLGINCSTVLDPQLAPEGHHVVDIIYVPAPYGNSRSWGLLGKDEYGVLKERAGDALVKVAEELTPGLSQHVVVRDVSTPLTYERYTNATDGCFNSPPLRGNIAFD